MTKSSRKITLNIPDIVHRILLFSDKNSRLTAMRVSSTWYEAAGPMLYRTITYHFDAYPFLRRTGQSVEKPASSNPFEEIPRDHLIQSMIISEDTSGRLVRGRSGPKRTRKVDLMRSCRILRIPYHNESRGCSSHANHLFKPDIVIFPYSTRNILDPYDPARNRLERKDFAANHNCPCLEILPSPSKLIIYYRSSQPACLTETQLLSAKSAQQIVFIISPYRLLANQVYLLGGRTNHGHRLTQLKDLTFILHHTSDMRRVMHSGTIDTLVDGIKNRHTLNSTQTTTIVGTEECLISTGVSAIEPRQQADKVDMEVKRRLFQSLIVSLEEKEQIWSRVHWFTKEEYMMRDPEDIEGELEELGWEI